MTADAALALGRRDRLPDALRVLVSELPRTGWAAHPNHSGLIAFWLDRHLMFRRLLDHLDADAQAMLDNGLDARDYQQRLSRFGGMLINQLHGHHQIEDAQYFPLLSGLDTPVAGGFALLDADHGAMDALLDALARSANAVFTANAARDSVATFRKTLVGFAPLLDRHLVDEEELVVPVLLKYDPPELR